MAIQKAAVWLSAHIKAKTGSKLDDRALMQLIFAPEPPRSDRCDFIWRVIRKTIIGNPDNWAATFSRKARSRGYGT